MAKSERQQTNEDALIQFLAPFEFISFMDADAIACGEIRAKLERKGQGIGPYDLQIAAQAISRKMTLITNISRKFQRVPDLVYENWAIAS
ncbi:PIN domain-containing protein [Cyclobacterium xiamenense]|uniref:PIN domain-containing protein n=1 Tax=Cyclobacterium xiamenense TaxID=1297121 RepID=UPI0015A6EC0F|nr:PIN domain-containing protein [Cyclobacterium xiamenense]